MGKTPTSSPVKKEDSPYGKPSPAAKPSKKWSDAEKLALLLFVIESAKPDWKSMDAGELFGGRSATQVGRTWRLEIEPQG